MKPPYASPTRGTGASLWALTLTLTLTLTLALPVALAAQPRPAPAPDSLTRLLARTPADTTRLLVLEELLQQPADQAALFAYARQGQVLARRLWHPRFEARFLLAQGRLQPYQDNVRAAAAFQRVLRLSERAGLGAFTYAAQAELGLASIAGSEDDLRGAAAHSRRALHHAARITSGQRNRLTMEGKALSLLSQTYTQRIDREGLVDSLRRQARRYGQAIVGVARQMQALEGSGPAPLGLMANYWSHSSDLYASEGRLDSALVLGRRAAAAYERLGELGPYLTVQQHLINAEAQAGHHAQAVALARDIRALAHSQGMGLLEADCLSSMALSLDALGQGRAAYQASARALVMRDSILSADNRRAVSELQVRFDSERQQARIRTLTQQQQLTAARAAQQRQRQLTWLVAAAAALLLGGAYVWQRVAAARRAADLALRGRLAADLHDEVGALLTRVTMRTELLQVDDDRPELDELLQESRSAASTVRDIIWSVNPDADTVGALVDRLRDLRDQTSRATPAPVRLELAPATLDVDLRLRPHVRQHAYLICKEAVTNALKHAAPGRPVCLALHIAPDALTLTVDSETDPAGPAPARTGQGQRNMAQRAKLLGAELQSHPTPQGWQVRLRVPKPLV